MRLSFALAGLALMAAAVFGAGPALAQAPAMAPPPGGFADLADRLMPAVVNIATTQKIDLGADAPRFPRGSPLERFNDMLGDQGGEVNSLGSGFVISADGVIVTNNHVIEEADEISVIFQDGETLRAALVGRDPATDLAVLRVKADRALPSVRWGVSGDVRVGQWVIAIGNPFGLGGSVSAGIISARNRNIDAGRYDDFLQTDAAINRGNSGGPLFNMAGDVIGVNTAIVSPTGGSVGVGFATPSDLARGVVDQILEFGEARRGWLGVRIGSVSPDAASRNGLNRARGAMVSGVTDGGPAARAGLRPGDIIVTFDGKEVGESRTIFRMVAEAAIGRAVTVEFLRAGKRMSTAVTVERLRDEVALASAERPRAGAEGEAPREAPTGASGRVLGMTLSELTPDLRRRQGLEASQKGLLIVSVDPLADAAKKVRPGDVIIEMQFEPVETIGQARALAARGERTGAPRPTLLHILRDGALTFRSVSPKR